MHRTLIALYIAGIIAGAAHADGHLAGAPMPTMTAHGAGDCRVETTTETVHGVRIHRSRPIGCEGPTGAAAAPAPAGSAISVRADARVIFQSRRRSTSLNALGAPGHLRGTRVRENSVLGAPTR